MKYDTLTRRYADWLFPLIDRVDCGYLHADDRPRAFHTDRRLESRDWDYPPTPITRTHLQRHLSNEDTLYYRSSHKSGFVLAMVDIDAKKDQTDAQTVADWLIASYLPGAYCEPSTRGRGRHVYVLFRVGTQGRRVVNAALAKTAAALRALALRVGFASNICGIYGNYTLWSSQAEGGGILKRGAMGKIPRLPNGLRSLDLLVSAPVFLPNALLPIIADADRLTPLSPISCTKVSTSESDPNATNVAQVPTGHRMVSASCTKTSTSESADKAKLDALRQRAAAAQNPMARMRRASSLFYHENGRYAADDDELVRFYESQGFYTGEDQYGRRRDRARLALDRHRETENVRTSRRYAEADYLPMIRQNVTQAVRTYPAIKYQYSVADELLAAGLYAYTKAAFAKNRIDRMHSFSDEGLIAMLSKLKSAGVIKSKFADKEKRVAIRQMLQLSGLIVLRDGNHVYGGREHGVGDKWGLGPNHVRFSEFVATFGHVVDPRSLPVLAEAKRAG